jgi:hypothetical protein
MKRRILEDETDMMDLDVGTWKFFSYSPPPEVDRPTYEIVGPTERYNSMEHQFSRIALGDSPLYADYYESHPKQKEIDEKNREYSEKTGRKLIDQDPINEALAITTFARAIFLGSQKQLVKKAEMRLMPVGRVRQNKVIPDPKQMTRKIKAYGLHLGAGKVRIAQLKERWVYNDQSGPENSLLEKSSD